MTWERIQDAFGAQYRLRLDGHRITVWRPDTQARRWEWEIRGAPGFRQLAGGNERTMTDAKAVAVAVVDARTRL